MYSLTDELQDACDSARALRNECRALEGDRAFVDRQRVLLRSAIDAQTILVAMAWDDVRRIQGLIDKDATGGSP